MDENRLDEKVQQETEKEISTESADAVENPGAGETPETIDENEPGAIRIRYRNGYDDVLHGVTVRQKLTNEKARFWQLLMLSLLSVANIVNFFLNTKEHQTSLFVGIVGAVITCIIYVMPDIRARQIAKAVAEVDEDFLFSVFSNGVVMGEGEGRFVYLFSQDALRAYEDEKVFLVMTNTDKLFVVAKRFLAPGDEEKIREIFTEAMGNNFLIKCHE